MRQTVRGRSVHEPPAGQQAQDTVGCVTRGGCGFVAGLATTGAAGGATTQRGGHGTFHPPEQQDAWQHSREGAVPVRATRRGAWWSAASGREGLSSLAGLAGSGLDPRHPLSVNTRSVRPSPPHDTLANPRQPSLAVTRARQSVENRPPAGPTNRTRPSPPERATCSTGVPVKSNHQPEQGPAVLRPRVRGLTRPVSACDCI